MRVQPVAPIVRETPSKASTISVQPSQPASPSRGRNAFAPSIVGAAASAKLNVVTVKPEIHSGSLPRKTSARVFAGMICWAVQSGHR